MQTAQTVATEQKKEETEVVSAPTENNTPTEDTKGQAPRLSWDEIMKDPEYNKQMQAVVQSRLRTAKGAEEALGKMAPAIEVMARKYGLDPNNMDYDALAKAINDDDAYYEDKALEMGVSIETAKKVDQMERDTERQKAMEQRTLQEQALQQHFISLERQGEELKKIFPNFDLRKELQNPAFARMTAPGKGIMSVEDAYRAVHRQEIDSAASQIIAQKTAEKISNAIQSGSRRPDESGASSQAPSVSTFDYSKASREQREAFKRDLRARMARGEKVYPGQR
jgi:DNA-binding transcriptional MerR regulator